MLTPEQVEKMLQEKMAEIRATKEFQERDWYILYQQGLKLQQDIKKIRKIKGQS